MLHGEVKVNYNQIASWEAVRIEDGQENTYRCKVAYRDTTGYLRETGPFIVHHKYDEGALILGALVLSRANFLFKRQDEEIVKAESNIEDAGTLRLLRAIFGGDAQ